MRRSCSSFALAACVVALAAVPARAQYNEYEARYGSTIEVSIDNLLQMPESYVDKAVRTHGELEMLFGSGERRYALRGTFGGRIRIMPMTEVAAEFDDMARRWMGRQVEVTGLVGRGTDSSTGQQMIYIAIWGFVGPPEEKEHSGPVTPATLEELVTKPGKLDGKLVAVRGQFRGQNLFGDLPSSSRERSADWVIKEELFAAWVTGRKPKGPGWAFDAGLKRDTGKWLLVTGRVSTRRGVVTLEATSVVISKPPSPTAEAPPPPKAPPAPPRPKKAPVVVFSLPLDGEREVAPNTVFRMQFSKDMEETSFKDRVVLRYVGRAQPGDRELDSVKVSYDGGPRSLQIDPGDLLRPGRVVEILLLPGIVDLDGMGLEPRPGSNPGAGGATDVLRFQIGRAGVAGSSP